MKAALLTNPSHSAFNSFKHTLRKKWKCEMNTSRTFLYFLKSSLSSTYYNIPCVVRTRSGKNFRKIIKNGGWGGGENRLKSAKSPKNEEELMEENFCDNKQNNKRQQQQQRPAARTFKQTVILFPKFFRNR